MLRITLALTLALVAFASASTEEGKAWLAEKAAEEGVVTLASGLQYKVRCISSLLSLPCKHTWKISLQKSRGGERERGRGAVTLRTAGRVLLQHRLQHGMHRQSWLTVYHSCAVPCGIPELAPLIIVLRKTKFDWWCHWMDGHVCMLCAGCQER